MSGDHIEAELIEAMYRIAELERKMDSMFRAGRVAERKYDEEAKRWHVRLRVGGSDKEPMLGPWVPYSQLAFGDKALNVHFVPKVGAQMFLLSPSGDYQQALAIPLSWWNEHPAPSKDADEVVLTHGKIKVTLKGDEVRVEADRLAVKVGKEFIVESGDKKLRVTPSASRRSSGPSSAWTSPTRSSSRGSRRKTARRSRSFRRCDAYAALCGYEEGPACRRRPAAHRRRRADDALRCRSGRAACGEAHQTEDDQGGEAEARGQV
ncbi:phage baseplate assembly protein V [Rhodopseudomonas palustris]|nr:phage baseplate assembly protein V [Rhodopseudomonas palustris]